MAASFSTVALFREVLSDKFVTDNRQLSPARISLIKLSIGNSTSSVGRASCDVERFSSFVSVHFNNIKDVYKNV